MSPLYVRKDECIIMALCMQQDSIKKKAVEIMKKVGFARGTVDPCLHMKKSLKGIIYVALYVDDNLMMGNPKAIDKAVEQLKKNRLELKVIEILWDYLSCEI